MKLLFIGYLIALVGNVVALAFVLIALVKFLVKLTIKLLPALPLLFLTLALLAAGNANVLAAAPQEVVNFALIDQHGRMHELKRTDAKAVVLFFTANGCPVARHSAPKLVELEAKFADRGVELWLVNANTADDRESIAKEAIELKLGFLPVLKDDTQGVARHLGVKRTAECVAISASDWKVFYRGAIDDQLVEGARKPEPTEPYLDAALTQFLDRQPSARPTTSARGCLISFDGGEGPDGAPVSYANQVAPILQLRCVECHSPGNVGSWAMTSHAKIKSMAAMIEEVILARRMPPWDADPYIGKFENHAALKVVESQTLLRWIHQGASRGEGVDPLDSMPAAPAKDWPLGKPDIILRLPQAEQIPATGTLEYRHVELAVGNAVPAWVRGSWVRPGNKQVVHHVIAWLKEDDEKKDLAEREHLAGYAPGSTQGWHPGGTGKLLPKEARLDIELHYTPSGTATTDQTEIGLYLAPAGTAPKPLDTLWIYNPDFKVQPGDSDSQHHAVYAFKQGATLYNLMPHMHLRGKWMTFELLLPSGERELLLSVPRYDFNWQRTYTLTKPKPIPAGSWLLITGSYDNSRLNPANPDPKKTIRWGQQSFEEMFLGIADVTWNDQPPKVALQP